ncbi:lysozyme inhibitor LprI family protein [Pseudomonas sp. B35(2017)]|uniref:lysozyme inhibitor LprI family protein n=1 Tax=Pseudomonas sp. B35(2017) TaxID=1981722 RepID=UPI000A1E059F|nr:lysozyme inhibitor LprI family protein [Pseudomonas sp. B35(2017)]
MFVRIITLFLGCLIASFAMAEDGCKEITVSSQVDRCAEAALKDSDAQLNASYKKLLARFESQQRRDPEQGKALVSMARESQRAWIKLRDTTCPLEATEIEPGMAAHVTTINNCMARMSLERAAYLDTIVADEPGNVVDLNKVFLSGSQRFGNVVARYVSTFGSPCLTVQILAPNGGWRVLSSKRFCSFDGKSFWSDYADAGFDGHVFAGDGLHVTLRLTELRPIGEKRLDCVIPIQNEQVKELNCGAPEPL